MANPMNVIPQASNKVSSPLELKNSSKQDGNDLKELFQKNLSDELNPATDLAEVALAAGMVSAPVIAPAVITPTVMAPSNESTKIDNAEIIAKGIQVPNQLPVKNVDPKLMNPAALAALMQNAKMKGDVNQPMNTELAALMNEQGLMVLPEEHDFNVESLEVLPKEASSKLSTTDFINLREISQNPVKQNLMSAVQSPALTDPAKLVPLPVAGAVVGMKPTQKIKSDENQNLEAAMSGLVPAHDEKQVFGKTLEATVSQTNGQKPVLSPMSLSQISNQVNLLGQARQDGEVKIRLRPDHLGELQMSVRTQGQNVSVQIRAENNEAKKIIEDSLGSLREHLSLQNLSLSRIDVVVQPTASSNLEQTQMQFDANQNFNQSSANEGGRNGSQERSQSGQEFNRENKTFASSQPAMIRPKIADSTRLDLIA